MVKLKQKSTISLHFEKHKSGPRGLQLHNERDGNGRHSNKNIDTTRTKDNIILVGDDGRTFAERITHILDENYTGKRAIRKDAIRMVEATVQIGGDIANATEDEQIEFLKESFEWLKNEYGEQNIVSATIHVDETTPHLHFDFVPLTKEGKLSAKTILGDKNKMRKTQEKFLKHHQENANGFRFARKEDGSFNGLEQHLYEQMTKSARELSELLDSEMEEQEQELEEREEKLNQRESHLNAVREELDQKGIKLSEYEQNLSERTRMENKRILEQKQQLKEREKELDERESHLNTVVGEVNQRSAKLSEDEQNLAERKRIANKRILEQKQQLEEREKNLNQRESHLNAVREELDQKGIKLSEYEQNLSERTRMANNRILQQEQQLKEREKNLNQREASANQLLNHANERIQKAEHVEREARKAIEELKALKESLTKWAKSFFKTVKETVGRWTSKVMNDKREEFANYFETRTNKLMDDLEAHQEITDDMIMLSEEDLASYDNDMHDEWTR